MLPIAQVERRRLAEQVRLDRERSAAERNRTGQFATPTKMAAEIAQTVLALTAADGPIRFLEPCVGSGAFFAAIRTAAPHLRLERAVGVEQDERFAAAARELWASHGLDVVTADFTTQAPTEQFNLLVTNPPYIRHHHLDERTKRRLRAACEKAAGIRPSGLAGTHVHFPFLADPWLADGGLAAWLIPSEFMDVNYGTALLEYLRERVDLVRIHKYPPADTRFDDALVSSAVVIYRKQPPGDAGVEFTSGSSMLTPEAVRVVGRSELGDRKWGRLFSAPPTPAASGICLGDLFHIRRGLATGNNDFFILDRSEAERRRLPARFCRPILPGPRGLPEDTVGADPDGFPRLDPQLVLIDCELPEAEVRERYPTLWAYLSEGENEGVGQGYLTSRRSPWYAQERRPPPPLLCQYMGRKTATKSPLRFIRNHSQATAHNVYLLLYPKPIIERAVRKSPDLLDEVFRTLREVDPAVLATNGRVYGGGMHKVEPGELARLPADRILERVPDLIRHEPSLFDVVG